MPKVKVIFILIFILFSYWFYYPLFILASNEYEIKNILLNSDQTFSVEIISNIENFNPSFKVGVSCDAKDYGYGLVYNLDKKISYSGGRWEDAPAFSLNNNDVITLLAGFTKQPECIEATVKVRAVVLPQTTKYLDVIFDSPINISSIFPPIVTPTLNLEEPVVTITPTPDDNNFSVPTTSEELSSDIELLINEEPVLNKVEKENIFITEFMPYPKESTNEWVEIYNNNEHSVNLKNWYIDDTVNSGGTPVLLNLNLQAKSYKIYEIYKSLLNNTGDTVSLLDDQKNLVHSISYKKSIKESSIQKNAFDNKWYITKSVTRGENNINIDTTYYLPKPTKNSSSNTQLLDKQNIEVKESIVISPESHLLSGEVLGLNTSSDLVASTVPYYRLPKKFTIEDNTKSKSYIITEDQIPSPIEVVISFFEKAFW